MESVNEQPNYYAIIPAPVRYSEKLSANEKLLYGELTALSQKEGYCWASNDYFAKLYKVSVRTIQYWLDNLEEQQFIERKEQNPQLKTLRKIFINEPWLVVRGMKKTSSRPMKKTSPK